MAEPYLGQIAIFSFSIAPKGWTFCNGQTLQIAQNNALFSLLGTYYGGDGITNFKLPNMQTRAALSTGQGQGLSNYTLGETGGEAAHTLTVQEMPSHTHGAAPSSDTTQITPVAGYWAPNTGGNNTYSATPAGTMSVNAVGLSGQSQPHPNMQPYLALNFCIALVGVYPSRN